MKFIKSICALALTVLLAVCTTSCGKSGDDDYVVEQAITTSFVHVYDISQGISADYTGIAYKITFNYSTAKADVTITGLKLPGNIQYTTIKLKDLDFKVDQAGYRIASGNDIPAVVEGFGTAPVFTQFHLSVLDRTISEGYYPAFCATFTIDGIYKCVSSIPGQILLGKTTSTSPAGDTYTDDSQIYVFLFDFETKRVTLSLNNAKFVSNMPAQNMEFRNMPYTIGNSGLITIEQPGTLIPYIGNTPFSAFPITDFKATVDLTSGSVVNFNCNAMGSDYHVEADLSYSYKPTSFE